MVFGARFRNTTTGSIQIDENYYNLAVKTSGSAATDRYPYSLNQCTSKIIAVTVEELPMIALRCTSNYVAVLRASLSGTTFTFEVVSNGGMGTSFDYWVFDRPAAAPTSGYGFRIKNRHTGLTAFYSGHKHMRTGGRRIIAPAHTSEHTYDAGTYAIILGNLPHVSSFVGGIYDEPNHQTQCQQTISIRGAKAITNGFRFQDFTAFNGFITLPGDLGGVSSIVDDRLKPTHLVVDVSGY